jgi:hypothetical protein
MIAHEQTSKAQATEEQGFNVASYELRTPSGAISFTLEVLQVEPGARWNLLE